MRGTSGTTDKSNGRLTRGPVGQTLWHLSWPMTLSLFSVIAFNIVDTFYIGRLGADQLAAMGFCFPVIFTMGSMAVGLGNGGASVVSRALGTGKPDRARRLVTNMLVLLTLISLGLMGFMYAFTDQVFALLRAPDHLMPYINSYMRIWYSGLWFVIMPVAANTLIRAHGEAVAPSIMMVIAAFMNAVISPVLIFGLLGFPSLGMEGAAIATVMARGTVFMFALYYIGVRQKMMEISWRAVLALPRHFRNIARFAGPAILSQIAAPISTALIVYILAGYGDEAVAGFTIGARIETLALIPFFALQAGVGPFIGQNVGAKLSARVLQAEGWIWRFSVAWGLISLVLLTSFGGFIGSLFTDNSEIIRLTDTYLMYVSFAFVFAGVFQAGIGVLNPLGYPVLGAAMSAVRYLIFYVGLAWLLSTGIISGLEGPVGVFAASAIAWVLAGLIAAGLIHRLLPKKASDDLLSNPALSASPPTVMGATKTDIKIPAK